MAESHFGALSGRLTPAVRADDLRRVWSFLVSNQGPGAGQSVGLSILAGLCESQEDVLAVWCRATLIELLTRQGCLDPWRKANSLHDKVIDMVASFPLPHGPEKADLNAVVAALA